MFTMDKFENYGLFHKEVIEFYGEINIEEIPKRVPYHLILKSSREFRD